MSRMLTVGKVLPGCAGLLDGDDETPLPSASTMMVKNFVLSARLPGEATKLFWTLLPVNQVGTSTALERSALR